MRRWLPGIGRRKPTVPDRELPDDQLRVAWQLVSLLLEYPSVKLFQRLTRLRAAAEQLPAAVGEPLVGVIDCLEQQGLEKSRRLYVETFDYTRKCALHLTYYAHGDSRKRGVALVQFKQVYRRAGMELEGEELPDHLSVVLEFGALGDLDVAWDLVNRHRAGVELLAMALEHRRGRVPSPRSGPRCRPSTANRLKPSRSCSATVLSLRRWAWSPTASIPS